MGGSGDLVQNGVNPLLLPVLERHPRLRVQTAPSIAYNYLGFNLEDPVLAQLGVRRAIAHALDREAIVATRFAGTARLATGMLAPGHWAFEGDLPRYGHDPALARRLLDEAGFADPDGEGPEPRLRLTLKTTSNRFRRSIARVLAHQLGQVGIAVEVRAYEWGTFFADVRSGNFQLFTLQWPAVVEPDLYHWIFHSSMIPSPDNGGRGANRGRYRNPALDALIEAGRRTPERDARRAIYSQVQRILAQDLPYVSLWHEDNVAVLDRSLQGYHILPNARFGGLVEVFRGQADAGL
jgi:peptide/nickel transport system substrate-binding protein